MCCVPNAIRVLVASALAPIIAPTLTDRLGADVHCATGPDSLRRAVDGRVRFDVVLADLIWNDIELEYAFDGLDVLAVLSRLNRTAPVIAATQGQSVEFDHLAEILDHPDVVGVCQKPAGPASLLDAVSRVSAGRPLPTRLFPTGLPTGAPPIHQYFASGRRGLTAGRLAGAIADRRASDAASLHAATGIPLNTVNKLGGYLGPLITARAEHPRELPVTAPVIYRWCGEHRHYLTSWYRRHGAVVP
jgi:hypothetical protein